MAIAPPAPCGYNGGVSEPGQLLHLVFGGELADPRGSVFVDTRELDVVGIFPNYAAALAAWRAKALATVDDAHTRYYIVHLHRLLDPEEHKTAE